MSRFQRAKKVHRQANLDDLSKELTEIRYKLDPDSDEDANFALKCLTMCTQYDLSAEDFVVQFDAWRMARKMKGRMTLADLDKLGQTIQETIEAERRRAQKQAGTGVRVKIESGRAAAGLIRPAQKAAMAFDHASLSSQRGKPAGSTGDMMEDLFDDDEPIAVKKEVMDVDGSEATPTPKRKVPSDEQTQGGEDGEEEKEGASARKRAAGDRDGEDQDASFTDQSAGDAHTPATSAASAAAHLAKPFRPSFALLARGPDGRTHEALYPKALGKYISRDKVGEAACPSLNDKELTQMYAPPLEPTPEDQAELAGRLVEMEVFRPDQELLAEKDEDEEKSEEEKKSSDAAAGVTIGKSGARYSVRGRNQNGNGSSTASHQSHTGGIDTSIFRYMYQNDDDLREGLDANLQECVRIMQEKDDWEDMRRLVKIERTTQTKQTKKEILKQTTLVKKEPTSTPMDTSSSLATQPPAEEEKKDGDVEMTDASAPAAAASPASPSAAAAAASSSSTPAAASSTPPTSSAAAAAAPISVDDELDEDGESTNIIPLVSIGTSKSQQSVILAGRVVYDANDVSGESATDVVQKLTSNAAVWIEGDRMANNGARIQVRLGGLRQFALFPGQIVLTKGINATGQNFVAEELLSDASLGHFGLKRSAVERYNRSLGFRPLGIMFAAGPFTTTEDLSFAPLFDLLREAIRLRPDVLLLQGPFLDADHPSLQANEGAVSNTYDVLFTRLVADIMSHLSGLATKVWIVPSTRDAAAIPVFPQPAFTLPTHGGGTAAQELHRDLATGRLTFLPNPCTLRLNDFVIGCSSVDVISHLTNANEIAKVPTPTHPGQPDPPGRLQRLASHLITAHSYYPLFPPPEGVYLDASHSASLLMPVTPDLLFLPSKMKCFASQVEVGGPGPDAKRRTIVVNPEYLTKGPSGGTYALVSVHPLKEEEMVPTSDATYGRIYDHHMMARTRVDILRI